MCRSPVLSWLLLSLTNLPLITAQAGKSVSNTAISTVVTDQVGAGAGARGVEEESVTAVSCDKKRNRGGGGGGGGRNERVRVIKVGMLEE